MPEQETATGLDPDDDVRLEVQQLHEDRQDARHANEIEAARERWRSDIGPHIRMRAFECVKPSLLILKDRQIEDDVETSLILAEKIAQWALGGDR